MRRVKTLVFVAVLAMMVFGLVGIASASVSTSDDAIARLQALKVVTGYEDGSFKPEQNITRAEFCAIAVRALGLEAASKAAIGATKFADVPATHWASGYVNLAVANGVIKGYPDGTFQPENNVTYAESFAMLVRVLGYDPAVKGEWPTNYMGKASQLGLLDNVVVSDYNANATRGNIFIGTANAADTEVMVRSTYGDKEEYTVSDKTLMQDKLAVTKYAEGLVDSTPATGLAKDKLNIHYVAVGITPASDKQVTVSSLDPNDYLGLSVEAWEKDDKVFFIDIKTDKDNIIVDKIKNTPAANATQIYLDAKDKNYTLAANAVTIKRNFVVATVGDLRKNDKVRVILDGSGNVKYIDARTTTKAMVDSVKVADEKIVFEKPNGSLNMQNGIYNIFKNGKAAGLADIKESDILEYIVNGSYWYILASDKVVEGQLDGAATDGVWSDVAPSNTVNKIKITVEGKLYTVNSSYWTSTDNGTNFDPNTLNGSLADFNSLYGNSVKLRLTPGGNAFAIIAAEASADVEFTALIRDIVVDTSALNDNKAYIKVSKFDDTETYYEVTDDDTKINSYTINDPLVTAIANPDVISETHGGATTTVSVNDVVKISLASDGKKVKNIKTYGTDLIQYGAGQTPVTINKDNDIITLGANNDFKVNSNTMVLKVKDYATAANDWNTAALNVNPVKDTDASSWSAIENLSANQLTTLRVAVVVKDGIAKYILIRNNNTNLANLSSSYSYGMVKLTGSNADGDYVQMDVKGENKSYKGTIGSAAKGILVRFKLDTSNELDSGSTVTAANTTVGGVVYDRFIVDSVDTTNNMIKVYAYDSTAGAAIANTARYINFNAEKTLVYYFYNNNTPTKIGLEDLCKDDVVKVYDTYDKDGNDSGNGTTDGVFDFIVKTSK